MLIAQTRLPLDQFQHPDLRNLVWCLTSPALWQTSSLPILQRLPVTQLQHSLQQLELRPQPLLEALSHTRSHRLGSYYESLWHFILEKLYQPRRCYYGVAVRDQHRRTLGEYDFLIQQARQSQYLHLELCIKFYLGFVRPGRAPRWLGLSPRDQLDQKINHLTQHQLKLGDLASARTQQRRLRLQLGPQVGWMQGRLFYPWEQEIKRPYYCNSWHLRGWWASLEQFHCWFVQQHNVRIQPLLKTQWLAPLAPAQIAPDPEPGLPEIKNGQPLMVARLINTPFGWREQDRGVIVTDAWLRSESVLEALDQA